MHRPWLKKQSAGERGQLQHTCPAYTQRGKLRRRVDCLVSSSADGIVKKLQEPGGETKLASPALKSTVRPQGPSKPYFPPGKIRALDRINTESGASKLDKTLLDPARYPRKPIQATGPSSQDEQWGCGPRPWEDKRAGVQAGVLAGTKSLQLSQTGQLSSGGAWIAREPARFGMQK